MQWARGGERCSQSEVMLIDGGFNLDRATRKIGELSSGIIICFQ